ncbi:glycosyltransferase [Acinetobacter boissieri]|uniref:glycosyltransferase n=1 Tax=Acinetobacter boissieri TaxID=1219383 RepID=UPI000B8907CD|nr:glycosyltransferase [Acinetobacter boissieri]
MDTSNITLCLTIGQRPQLLRQTLESLFKQAQFEHIIAINDFGDEETNAVFKALCPHGQLICLEQRLGHHAAVDYMYSHVKTEYIFHCEDDWHFNSLPNFENTFELLSKQPQASCVSLRHCNDFYFKEEEKQYIQYETILGTHVVRLDVLHKQWHGYTFNPHIANIQLWQSFNKNFAQFKKERHISRKLRAKNKYMLYLADGNCHHIGATQSVSNPPKERFFSKENLNTMLRQVFKYS